MDLPWRHHGTEMSIAEVDQLDQRIDCPPCRKYSRAVQARTRAIIKTLEMDDLDAEMDKERLAQIMVNEGLAHSNAEGFIKNYLGWSKGKCLMAFGLTHSWQHVGEMEVIASLLGVEFG